MSEKIPTDQKGQEKNQQGPTQGKRHFKEPRLKFIKPKLTRHGSVTNITQFASSFNP